MSKKGQAKNNTSKNKDKKENIKEENVKAENKKEEKVVENKEKKNKKAKPANTQLEKEKKRAEAKKKVTKMLEKIDNNRYVIISFIIGVLITVIIARIMWPERIATLKDGTQPVATIDGTIITADDLYEDMKSSYSIQLLLDNIDKMILEDLYPETDEMVDEVNNQYESYLSSYSSMGYTEETFISENGFSSKDELLDYLKLNNRRKKYTEDYIEKNLKDQEIEDYYNKNVYGDINCQHILVKTSEDVDEAAAKSKAEEIIDKLNNGTSWEDVKKEYADSTTFEDLGYEAWNANLETSFLEGLKSLSDNSYSKEPVQTSYGYHVIYRLDQKEKPSFDDSKKDVIDKLIENKQQEDNNISSKSLISLRKEKNLTFSDTNLEKKYKDYCDSIK